MKIQFTLFLFFLINISMMSQEVESKYLKSIIFLQSNEEIGKEIKNIYKKEFKEYCSIPFQISKKISFQEIGVFEDYLEKNINIDQFYKENYFESFDNNLSELLPRRKKSIKIHFSKPVGNLLLIELSPKELSGSPFKFGTTIKVLLFFDDKGRIKDSFFESFINN